METREYRPELDALRLAACLMVVLIHVTAQYTNALPAESAGQRAVWWLGCLFRSSAVPLFVMISGSLFLSRPEPIPLRRLIGRYLLRLLLLYCVWALLYAADAVGLRALGTLQGWKTLLVSAARGKYHLWYLQRLFGTYALMPLLWCLVHAREGRCVPYVLAASLLCLTLKDTALAFQAPEWLRDFLTQFEFPLNSFAPFFLLGWYLSDRARFRLSAPLWALIWLAVVAAKTAAETLWGGSVLQAEALLQITALPAYLEAAALFLLFRSLSGSAFLARHAASLRALAANTLGIYLLHVFVLEHLFQPWRQLTAAWPAALAAVLFTLAVFLLSLAAVFLLRRLPPLRRWLL